MNKPRAKRKPSELHRHIHIHGHGKWSFRWERFVRNRGRKRAQKLARKHSPVTRHRH